MFDEIAYILPQEVRRDIFFRISKNTEELRFRLGRPVCCVAQNRECVVLQRSISAQDLDHILTAASRNSVYSINHCLKEGYLILPGGHRLGFCGQVVMGDKNAVTLRNISSVSIRFSKKIMDIAPTLCSSTLLVGPPGCGKTTMLRDCVRKISDVRRERVSIVDERGEIACAGQGETIAELGLRTDVLTGIDKKNGIDFVLRTMNPQWIAVDEITKEEDVRTIVEASYCGVRFLATAHAASKEDFFKRPIYKYLMGAEIFRKILLLDTDHAFVLEDI